MLMTQTFCCGLDDGRETKKRVLISSDDGAMRQATRHLESAQLVVNVLQGSNSASDAVLNMGDQSNNMLILA